MKKLIEYDSVEIVSPKNIITGGGGSLRSLCDELKKRGVNSSMIYSDGRDGFRKLFTSTIKSSNTLRIFPEIYTSLASKSNSTDVVIWWLSIGNFTCKKFENIFSDFFKYGKKVITCQRPILKKKHLSKFNHWAESNAAVDYLKSYDIESIRLPRLLNEIFYQPTISIPKNKTITYNYSKSHNILEKFIRQNADYKFIPLRGYSIREIHSILSESSIYLDFGHFPGSERLPREAALLNNSLCISTRGCSPNRLDFPIDDFFKLDHQSPDFNIQLKERLEIIFSSETPNSIDLKNSVLLDRKHQNKILELLIV